MNQVLRVARIQLVNARAVIGLPVGILLLVLAANIVIFLAMGTPALNGEGVITGGLLSIYITMVLAHLQTMTQMFPFAVGMSITRRAFLLATALIVTAQALGYSVLLWLLKLVEEATGGWGLDLAFFELPFLDHDNPLAQILVFAAPFLFCSFVGLWFGTVYQRWGQYGAWSLTIGLALLVVAVVAVVSWQRWWPAVLDFLDAQPMTVLFGVYPLLLGILFAAGTYITARRAVP
jgi:hypothetical protein